MNKTISIIITIITTATIINCKDHNDGTLFDGDIKFVNLFYPINPKVQTMYENGFRGGYKNKYEHPQHGVIKNKKFPYKYFDFSGTGTKVKRRV